VCVGGGGGGGFTLVLLWLDARAPLCVVQPELCGIYFLHAVLERDRLSARALCLSVCFFFFLKEDWRTERMFVGGSFMEETMLM